MKKHRLIQLSPAHPYTHPDSLFASQKGVKWLEEIGSDPWPRFPFWFCWVLAHQWVKVPLTLCRNLKFVRYLKQDIPLCPLLVLSHSISANVAIDSRRVDVYSYEPTPSLLASWLPLFLRLFEWEKHTNAFNLIFFFFFICCFCFSRRKLPSFRLLKTIVPSFFISIFFFFVHYRSLHLINNSFLLLFPIPREVWGAEGSSPRECQKDPINNIKM